MTKNSRFTEPFDKQHCQDLNTVEIITTPPLPYLLITVKEIQLKDIFLSDMQSLSNVC